MTVKLSDYVFRFVAGLGVTHVFEVTGGGAMHLNDSLGANADLEYVCMLHEQAAAMAAESYAKVRNDIGVCLVTTGPGGTNALTGVAGAWLDSTPMLVISGQVKRADLKGTTGVRQMGVQEVDIVAMATPVTKYAVTVTEPERIRYHLEKAAHLARTGRPGPVWIDIPLDVQGAMIDESSLPGFVPDTPPDVAAGDDISLAGAVRETIALLNASERPVLLVGNGVRLAHARAGLRALVDALGIPVLTTWPAHDLVPDDHPLMIGRPGPVAPRGANFALQNSDFVLALGARLDLVVTGYAPANFARAARKVMVDVDAAELRKMGDTVTLPVCADVGAFLERMRAALPAVATRDRSSWNARCRDWKAKYPVVLPEYRNLPSGVSTYVLAEAVAAASAPDDVIVSGSSGAGIEIFCLAVTLREGQRIFLTTALGAMGNGLPATIGACLAHGRRRVIAVDGDGGLQLNIQELEVIRRLQLPIKLFVLNNDGYASIRTSQSRYFGRLAGADATSGVTLPPLEGVARAYGVPYARLEHDRDLVRQVRAMLDAPGPLVVDVVTPREEPRAPSLASARRPDGSMVSRPLEDLWPFLPREEFRANMIIPPLPE
ncbi:MAG TPA: thiamine pyrophosphate-binding protein [Gemmatimonadaceae bacterium]|nr:thiamine pyrophosphate-binding protein [Gemmatimonadaceae bacterium]